ncbi:hypothetical protein [Frankia sp. BMG5.23]|uniref:hypothetical protein n=1 Tax=Frankia sp. BMG5.23 TaxID=683305 RepID=UPI0004615D57|nr:hypothetical protein [Frankia sp. BMG5.23]KDA44962.1 hypothetical protein BMG523Draft_00087 [Frankia sp. BMG5.23]
MTIKARKPKPPTGHIHRKARRAGRIKQTLITKDRENAAWDNNLAGIGEEDTVQEGRDRSLDRMSTRGRVGIRWKPNTAAR